MGIYEILVDIGEKMHVLIQQRQLSLGYLVPTIVNFTSRKTNK